MLLGRATRGVRWRWSIAGGLILIGALSSVLDGVDRAIVDLRSSFASIPASGAVIVVGIDAKSIDAMQQWPWPRRHHAAVIDRLVSAGAERVAIDIDFSSASNPTDDAALSAALARAGPLRVALPFFLQPQPEEDGTARIVTTAAHPLFASHAALANVNVIPDSDGIVRRYQLSEDLGGVRRPGLASWLQAGDSNALAREAIDDEIAVDFSIDVGTIPYVSFVDVLDGIADPAWFEDRLVLIGAVDLALGDFVATPRYRALPGVMFHALAAETLLLDRSLRMHGSWPLALLVAALVAAHGYRLDRLAWSKAALLTTSLTVLVAIAAAAGQALFAVTFDLDVFLIAWLIVSATIARRQVGLLALRRRALARKAERQRRLVEGIVANSFDGILTFSSSGRLLSVNPAATELLAASAPRLLGRTLATQLPEIADELLERCTEGRDYRGTIVLERPPLARRTLEAVMSTFLDDKIGSMVGVLVLHDVSEARATAAALDHLHHHDPLTGLPNKLLFERNLETMIDAARQASGSVRCIVIAIESLAEITVETLGDGIVAAVGQRLRQTVDAGVACARIGSVDFAFALPEQPTTEAMITKIKASLVDTYEVDGQQFSLDLKLGAASFPKDAAEARNLVRCATVAARCAQSGGNEVAAYQLPTDHNLKRRFTMLSALRRAIQEHDFSVEYQPKVDAQTLVLRGCEALVRWRSDEFGGISPAEFVPIAEDAGLIDDLTHAVVARVIQDQPQLTQGGLHVPVAINISGRSLSTTDGGRSLFRHILERCADPAKLAFEITETAIMDDPDRAVALLQQLKDGGFEVMLDDFGTGYSSFGRLRELPLHGVKLDRSLVHLAPGDQSGEEVIASVIELTKRLGLSTVAEGVETIAELDRLRHLGCNLIQGYLTGTPMEATALVEWAQTGGARSLVSQARQQHGQRQNSLSTRSTRHPTAATASMSADRDVTERMTILG